eukprot:CAMPEP_0185428346 /NCGR_PEP_ID=MMETSP1365-20130426/16041_1 /TAXON_ID=38817 /ORGANISM="Gephyrocapsa oceanica, Strain RCC1303" /LENGTH=56 /DNA_ID=CAMNT_0028032529 /DNA_START=187 /DNA_END=354 /DNA_ORIENTATION=+
MVPQSWRHAEDMLQCHARPFAHAAAARRAKPCPRGPQRPHTTHHCQLHALAARRTT